MTTILLADEREKRLATVYDPVCGSGNLLRILQSQLHQPMSVYGQDISERMISLNGLLAKTSNNRDCYFVSGDVLEEDRFSSKHFDYVVADLPIRMKIDGRRLWNDNRFPMGIPSNNDATGLFIQHIVSKMAFKGRAVFTCLPSFFFEELSYSERLRSWLLKLDIIECVIALPGGFIPGTMVKTCLCVLNNNKSRKRKGTIQIINAESLFPRQKNRGIVLTEKSLEILEFIYRSFENNEYCYIAYHDEFYQYEVDVKQPTRREDGTLVLVDGKVVADRKKTVHVVIPNGEQNIEEYINRDIINHLDKDSWIDQTSVRERNIIDINAPFVKKQEERSVSVVKKDVLTLGDNITTLFANLFAENKHISRTHSPSGSRSMQALLGSVVRVVRSRTPLMRSGMKRKYPVLNPDYLRGYISEPSEYVESVVDDQVVNDGDVLVLMDGENAGEVFRGKYGCLPKTMIKLDYSDSVFDKDFFYYLLKAREPELRLKTRGDAIKHLSITDLRFLRIAIPPIPLQITMARSLSPQIEVIDKLLPMLGGTARETLLEYRQTLIRDAITSFALDMN